MQLDLRMELFDVVVRYEIALWNVVDGALADAAAVSLAQLQALTLVEEMSGAARVLDIAEGIGVTIGAASKLVDRLERDGLAERHPNPNDRRSSLIALTPEGGSEYRKAAEVRSSILAKIVEPAVAAPAVAALSELQLRLDEFRTGARR
jgi:DNA-binding MarR family transcriptional regulator